MSFQFERYQIDFQYLQYKFDGHYSSYLKVYDILCVSGLMWGSSGVWDICVEIAKVFVLR